MISGAGKEMLEYGKGVEGSILKGIFLMQRLGE